MAERRTRGPGRWSRLSVRARATATATAVVALALLATSLLLVDQLQRHLTDEAERVLHQQVTQVATQLREARPGVLVQPLQATTLRVQSPDGELLAATPAQVALPAVPGTPPAPEAVPAIPPESAAGTPAAPPEGVPIAARTVSTTVDTPEGPRVVSASSTLDSVREATGAAVRGLLLAMPALLLLVAVITWFATGRALRPVESIRREFAEITTHDLHRRVPVPDTRDEVAELARTMNGTLDRLDRSVAMQRQFIADASHELRSPLATVRTPLEVAARRPERANWPSVTADALGDLDRLQALTSDLLLLARLDAGSPARSVLLDLADLVRAEVGRRSGPVVLDTAEPVRVRGNRAQLTRLLTNLLDNAERHAVDAVRVAVRPRGRWAVLEVADDGPGIPPADREKVFQRFTRLDDARGRDDGGSGLGLPISREIAAAHGGTLEAEDSESGACLVARLPRDTVAQT
ncbi:HAMP domain-containing protein [Saccharopolyspora erythraea]|uniref:sensor histidine kinase n=1 Tax=Saccharopolyspora erythraea TaxID=1836 RepID=UPI001BEE4693|nr:HAMP domain-containing sensor histidine kinase [Saccharopolyspora erythraea]QUH04789.1 HAMP domain-containing protein [Saccharopolyspora erythraea]